MKHLTSLFDLTPVDVRDILSVAVRLKAELQSGRRTPLLAGRVLTLIFDKPSLRTRMSFEAAIMQLGGSSLFFSSKEAGLQGRESLSDVARVMSGYCDAVVVRTFSQQLVEDLARFSRCPVINGLSDDRHPCQALADILTIQETFGDLSGHRLVYVGDGNNVAASLAIIAAQVGLSITLCTPPAYALPASFLDELRRHDPTADVTSLTDPAEAVRNADVIYTDVWASMGQESEAAEREEIFAPYQVNSELMAAAPEHCRFMHCLPAHRGVEVTDDVLDGPQSIVFEQAENRMHLSKGLLVWLLGENS